MGLLGLAIPKWEGPTVCENSTAASEYADVKPPGAAAAREEESKKEERKREAAEVRDDGKAEEEPVPVKKERADAAVETNLEK